MGTKEGGKKAAETLKLRYGADYYLRLGSRGGQTSTGRAFRDNRELAREAGRKGGLISRKRRLNSSSA